MNSTARLAAKIKMKYKVLFGLALSVIILDQITKALVLEHFSLGMSIPIITNFFDLTYVQNRGAAFGFLADANPAFRTPFFIIVPLIALVSIGMVFKKLPEHDLKMSSALSLVIAGAFGNLVDRLYLGFVVDFLDFHWNRLYHFPAFNVADSAICIGVGLMMLDVFQNDANKFNEPKRRS